MQIVRTETSTGDASRTPRARIESLFTEDQEVEPEGYLDCSESEGWEISAEQGSPSRWSVQIEAWRQFVAAAEALDTQAAGEQAGGDDDKGGVYTYPFSNRFLPIGEGDDDGDLNSSNFAEKIAAFVAKYFDAAGKPRGGTTIMSAIRAGDAHFMDEFGKRPAGERPIRARVVFTDGELSDAGPFAEYMASSHDNQWREVFAVAVLGHGTDHDATLRQYQELAKTHTNIHVYSFGSVSNPAEIAEDMSIAVLATN
jgi:hypothetical protein